MTRKLFLTLIIFLSLLQTKAQCKDCQPKDDWKFAVGITLYSNNLYVYNENLLERQPLEFNFRYKLGQNHIVRLSTPIAWKVKLTRDPQYTEPNYALDESMKNKAMAYFDGLKHDVAYSDFFKTKRSYYNLFGGSIGYDYNMNLGLGISLAAGIDLNFYYYKSIQNFYSIDYSVLNGNNTATLSNLYYEELTNNRYAFSFKPNLALRYQFQKLLLEGNVGYAFTYSNFYADMQTQFFDMTDSHGTAYRKYDFRKMVLQLSLFYTL